MHYFRPSSHSHWNFVKNLINYIFPAYREMIGREFTMLGTLTYFIPMCVSVLMTMNRFFIVIRPTDQRVFGQRRIFFYSFLILVSLSVYDFNTIKYKTFRSSASLSSWSLVSPTAQSTSSLVHWSSWRHVLQKDILWQNSQISMQSGCRRPF